MATPENRTTFKIGDKTYLYDDFANFYNTYKQSYYDYARERGGFSQEQINQLDAEIAKALDLARNNGKFDTTGNFNRNNVQNIIVTKKRLGKDKKIQQGLTGRNSWLTNFIAKAGQHMNEYTENKSDQDFNNYTLGAWLKGNNQNAEYIFSNYDIAPDEDAIDGRKFNERGRLTYDILKGHQNFLLSNNFKFDNDENLYNDNYMDVLNKAIKMFEDGTGKYIFDDETYNKDEFDVRKLARYLDYLGANLGEGYDYTRALTSNQYKYPTEEERAQMTAEKEAKKEAAEKEAEEKEQERLLNLKNEWNNEFFNLRTLTTPFNDTHSPFIQYDYDNFIDFYKAIPTNNWDYYTYGNYINLNDPNDISKYWNKFLEFLKNPNDDTNNYNKNYKDNDKYINQRALLQLMYNSSQKDNIFLNLNNGWYLIADSYTDNGYGAAYNPISGELKQIYLGDYYNIPEIQQIYDDIRNTWIEKKYGQNKDYLTIFPKVAPPLKKEGGLINKYQNGDKFGQAIDYNSFSNAQDIQKRAKENNTSFKTQSEKERYIFEKNKTLNNPNAGWTGKETARLGYAIADLGSAIAAFVPGSGTIASAGLGLISTIGNFVTDLTDDAVTGKEAWRNLGLNLGMDALGLIPGGGAASKLGKIIRSLKTTVPLIVALPGVANMLSNSPEIAKSWKRAFDGDIEKGGEAMTYQDYMNILQVLNVAAGAVNIGTNVYKSRKSSVVDDSKIAVEVRDSNNNKKALILEGEDAKKFKESSDKSIEDAQKFLKTIEGGDKYTIVTNDVTIDRHGLKPWHKDSNGNTKGNLPYERIIEKRPVIMEIRQNTRLQELNKSRTKKGKNPKTPEKEIYAFGNQSIFGLGLRNKPDMWGNYLINISNKPKIENVLNQHIQTKNDELNSVIKSSRKYKSKIDQDKKRVSKLKELSTTYKENELNTAESELNSYNKKIENYNKSDFKKLDEIKVKLEKINKKLNNKRISEAEKSTLLQEYTTLISEKLKLETNLGKGHAKNYIDNRTKSNEKMKQKVKELQNKIKEIKEIRNKFENRSSSIDKKIPTTNSSYFKSALNIKPTKVIINGVEHNIMPTKYKIKDVEYNFDNNTWNKEYLESLGLFKQGGSINRNKLNKFLNYGKR